MNSDSTRFEYDDFEQYLLDAAAVDEAPADLPTRLGVALGLGVPILAAAELTSLAPTTTALEGIAQAGSSAVSGGVFGSLKASLGVTASTLWGTAIKGVAVGLITGTAAIGTGRAVAKLTSDDPRPNQAVATLPSRVHEKSLATRVAAATPVSAAASAEPITWLGVVEEQKAEATKARVFTSYSVPFSRVADPIAEPEEEKPRKRLARPIFPEKTYAVARYPIFWDDVSAYYDTPQKQHSAPAVAAFAEERPIDPAEVVEMRAKAIQRCRTYLGQSKPGLALNELNDFRSRVGDRYFGVDELLLHIEALATMGRAIEAQADVKVVERLAPNSAALRQAQQLAASRFVR
ncbi:MAG TPA: hypothetical protein VKP30_00805 [Polyangiaceae bacterium]|nr:hypothetical protein [Polyangiaceae bacterium]